MISRRMFHGRLIAALVALTSPPVRMAGAVTSGDDLWLNRLTFGANTAARADIARLGRAGWLEAQLAMPADDPDLQARLDAARLRIAYEAGEDEDGNRWSALDELRPCPV